MGSNTRRKMYITVSDYTYKKNTSYAQGCCQLYEMTCK